LSPIRRKIQRFSLCCGVLVPLVYFGAQLAAAPFYPGYSFLVNSASQLGSDASTFPALFNGGAIGIGIFVGLLTAFWAVRDGRAMRGYLWLTLLMFAALAPTMSGITPVDMNRYGGLMQRIAALVLYLPSAVTAWWLIRAGIRPRKRH
jgi:hypothetical membrane protein